MPINYEIRRAIIRRIKKDPNNNKENYNKMMKNPKYKGLTYQDYINTRSSYLKIKIINGYKWCGICNTRHIASAEVFGFNGYNINGSRRLHSNCLASRNRLKKNIRIMKDKRYDGMVAAAKKSKIKNGNYINYIPIKERSIEDQEKQRKEWRLASRRRNRKINKKPGNKKK